jgi:HD-GYP domain-containing protein (c-di-GMP phosphodiesterase class II)
VIAVCDAYEAMTTERSYRSAMSRSRAREELRREVSDIATAVAEKLVRKSLRDEDHRRIVNEEISRIRV